MCLDARWMTDCEVRLINYLSSMTDERRSSQVSEIKRLIFLSTAKQRKKGARYASTNKKKMSK